MEAGAHTHLRLEVQHPVVVLDDPMTDGKAQARAFVPGLGGEEGVEDPRLDLRRDAGALVGTVRRSQGRPA